MPLDCMYPIRFHHTLVYKTLTPLVVIIILVIYKSLRSDKEAKSRVLNYIL